MPNKKTSVPFQGTIEQERELKEILHGLKNEKGALVTALQKAQGIYGYLPIEVQKIISSELDIHLAEVYGVATFYSQFSLNPKGKYNVSVCLGTACYVKGAGDIMDELVKELKIENGGCTEDGVFSLEGCRCIGACGLAPVLTVNEDVYGKITKDDIKTILAKYK